MTHIFIITFLIINIIVFSLCLCSKLIESFKRQNEYYKKLDHAAILQSATRRKLSKRIYKKQKDYEDSTESTVFDSSDSDSPHFY